MAAATKGSLLPALQHPVLQPMLPADSKQPSLYRLVLEHGDFGIHNVPITLDAKGQPLVAPFYDWDRACYLVRSIDEFMLWSSGG